MAPSHQLLPGDFGAVEVLGLDLGRDAVDAARCEWLRGLLSRHGVVCIRLRDRLADEAMRLLVSMVGAIKDPVGLDRDGNELRYSDAKQVIDSGFVMTDELRAELGDGSLGGDDLRPGLFQFFHTDDSYVERPAAATVLHARALPSGGGGDTCFMDMRATFELLGPEERAAVIGRCAVHAYNNRGTFPPRASASGPLEALVEVAHPVVRAHPMVGTPALYFDLDRATHIDGMPIGEGRALLQRLQDDAEERAPRYAHEWQPNDVLIWDNASVQHRASGDFPVGEPRRFWRYMVEGPVPVAYEGP